MKRNEFGHIEMGLFAITDESLLLRGSVSSEVLLEIHTPIRPIAIYEKHKVNALEILTAFIYIEGDRRQVYLE